MMKTPEQIAEVYTLFSDIGEGRLPSNLTYGQKAVFRMMAAPLGWALGFNQPGEFVELQISRLLEERERVLPFLAEACCDGEFQL